MIRTLRILAGLVLLVGLAARLEIHHRSHFLDDDALITFRYAQHVAAGQGFVYNLGERVLGTTTPLFTLVLAAGIRAGLDPAPAALALDLAGYLLAGAFLYLLLERTGRAAMGLIGLSFYAASVSGLALADLSGLETPVYVALVLLGLYLHACGRSVAASVVAGLATLTRPEGVLLAAALWLGFAMERRRVPLREILAFALVCLPWAVFAQGYFGAVLPHSVVAKHVYASTHWMRTPLQIFQSFFVGRFRVLLGALGLVGAFFLVAGRARGLTPMLLWCIFYLAFFTAGGVLMHYWYLPPLFTPLLGLVGVAVVSLPMVLAAPFGASGSAGRTTATMILCLPLVFLGIRSGRAHRAAEMEATQGQRLLDGVHRRIGLWIARTTPPGARVYAADIGYVGYFSGRRILDAVGLVSPEAVRWNLRRDPVGLLREQRPEVCVLPAYGRDYPVILGDPWFRLNYRQVERFRDESMKSVHLAEDDPRRVSEYVPDYRLFLKSAGPAPAGGGGRP